MFQNTIFIFNYIIRFYFSPFCCMITISFAIFCWLFCSNISLLISWFSYRLRNTNLFFFTSVGMAVAEPYVLVWDVRCLRGNSKPGEGAWSLPTVSPPLLLHFLPAFSGRAVALSGDGHVALLHVNAPNATEHSVFQVSCKKIIFELENIICTYFILFCSLASL